MNYKNQPLADVQAVFLCPIEIALYFALFLHFNFSKQLILFLNKKLT
jgi:hypothetical protein